MHNEVSVEPGPRIVESGSPLMITPINRLSRNDLWDALDAGWADFKAAYIREDRFSGSRPFP